jgi:hypothetical protein
MKENVMERNDNIEAAVLPYEAVPDLQMRKHSLADRLRHGRVLIGVGMVIAVLGIVLYCATALAGDFGNEPAEYSTEGLSIIGTGVFVWIVGAVKYLNAAIDAGDAEDII